MNKEQLHYLNTLKTALKYLSANKHSMDSIQIMKIYKKVRNAEYSKLSPKLKITNRDIVNEAINNSSAPISFACMGVDHSYGKSVLKTLKWHNEYHEWCYSHALKRQPLTVAYNTLKTKEYRGWFSTLFYSIAIITDTILGFMTSLWLLWLLIPLVITTFYNAFNSSTRCDINYNYHLTTCNELYKVINDTYKKYTNVIGNPAVTFHHYREIKQNHTTWHELHQKLEQSELDALPKKASN